MSLNTRLNVWIDNRTDDPVSSLLFVIGTIAVILAIPMIVGILASYPDPQAAAVAGRWSSLVSALLLAAIAFSRLAYMNQRR